MNFVLVDHYQFWWPVSVFVPDPDNAGKMIEQTFDVLFQPETQEAAISADEMADDLVTVRDRVDHDRGRLAGIVKGWRGVVGKDGQPVPFGAESFGAALNVSWFRVAIWTAYREALSGARAGH